MNQLIPLSASGVIFAGAGVLFSYSLTAGVDAATVTLLRNSKDGSGGSVVGIIRCAANGYGERRFNGPIGMSDVYAVLTGTAPHFNAEI